MGNKAHFRGLQLIDKYWLSDVWSAILPPPWLREDQLVREVNRFLPKAVAIVGIL
jgi:hypothetical protein